VITSANCGTWRFPFLQQILLMPFLLSSPAVFTCFDIRGEV